MFFISHQNCYGETGGGHGVVYRLYIANKKYHYFDDVYYIFRDRIIYNEEDCGALAVNQSTLKNNRNAAKNVLKKLMPNKVKIVKSIISNANKVKKNKIWIEKIGKELKFSENDIYFFNDYFSAYAFVSVYNFSNSIFVFHMQGSIYNEWKALTGYESKYLKNKFDYIFKTIVGKTKILAFPSKGAEESLIKSDATLEEIVAKCKKEYLYNGVFCQEFTSKEIAKWVLDIAELKEIKFITVANLNAAKAVERIPRYLKKIKDKNIKFRWILVGNGVKEEEVQREIEKAEISQNTLWIKQFVKHEEVLQLFSITDFYILFQKFSIFDLSILEAMYYGNIPVLSHVGGNKEVIIDKNGFFVDRFDDAEELSNFIESGNLLKIKEKNKKIQSTMFNDEAMLKRYHDLCNTISLNEGKK